MHGPHRSTEQFQAFLEDLSECFWADSILCGLPNRAMTVTIDKLRGTRDFNRRAWVIIFKSL